MKQLAVLTSIIFAVAVYAATTRTIEGDQIRTTDRAVTLSFPAASTTLVGTGSSQTLTNKTISGASNTISNINLSSQVTSTLPIANGGTNNGSLGVTAGGVTYTDGSKLMNTGAGSSGQYLQSNGSSAPTWSTVTVTNSVTTKTTTYTATTSDNTILVSTASSWTLTLYTAVGNSGRRLFIKKTSSDTNTLTIDGNGSETIDGATTQIMRAQYDYFLLESDGSNWHVVDYRQNIGMRATSGSTTGITGTAATITYATSYDTYGGWSTNQYTVPVTGKYRVTCRVELASNTWGTGAVGCDLYVGGAFGFAIAYFQQATGSTASLVAPWAFGSREVNLTSGDVLTFRLFQTQTASVNMSGASNYNWIDIRYIDK
jgi:hypothetical protein